MVTIDVNVKNTVNSLEKINVIFQNQRKYRLFQTMAHLLLRTYWGETFAKSGARRGHAKWEPLSPAYAARKTKRGRTAMPLILTGALQGSGRVIKESAMDMQWGTENPVAEWHQDGTKRMPKREFLFLQSRDYEEIGVFLGSMVQVLIDREIK